MDICFWLLLCKVLTKAFSLLHPSLRFPKFLAVPIRTLKILTAAPFHPPFFRHRRRSGSKPAPSVLELEDLLQSNKKQVSLWISAFYGGVGETRTLAPGFSQPTPLAGAPRHQLEYYSVCRIYKNIRFRFWRRERDSNPCGLAP